MALLVCGCVYTAFNIDIKVVTHNTFFGDLTVLLSWSSVHSSTNIVLVLSSQWLHNKSWYGCPMICLILTACFHCWLLEAIFQWTSLCIYRVIFFKEIYVEYIPDGRTALLKDGTFKISIDITKLTFMMVVVAYMITSLNTSPWYPTQVYSKIFKDS